MLLDDTIKSIIEAKTCHKHDIHPVVEVNGGYYDLICCCANFKKVCITEIEKLLKPEPDMRLMITSA